jgi:hypothetical protein
MMSLVSFPYSKETPEIFDEWEWEWEWAWEREHWLHTADGMMRIGMLH